MAAAEAVGDFEDGHDEADTADEDPEERRHDDRKILPADDALVLQLEDAESRKYIRQRCSVDDALDGEN